MTPEQRFPVSAGMRKALLLLFVGLLGLFVFFSSPKMVSRQNSSKPLVAIQPAPEFSLQNVLGGDINSSSLKGKVIVVELWATWAVPAKTYIPEYNRLLRELKAEGLEIIGIAYDSGSLQDVAKASSELQIEYPIAMGTTKVDQAFGGHPGYPTTFVIGKDWQIYRKIMGISPSKVSNLEWDIRTLLAK